MSLYGQFVEMWGFVGLYRLHAKHSPYSNGEDPGHNGNRLARVTFIGKPLPCFLNHSSITARYTARPSFMLGYSAIASAITFAA
jgi:hypothetical protein